VQISIRFCIFFFQPTFYQGDQAAPVGEGGGNTTEPMETNSNEV